jgi:hypothetical protein
MRKLLPLFALAIACSCDEPRDPSKPPAPSTRDVAPPPAPPQSLAITFEPPAEWRAEKPASNMRKAQYAVPDKDKAEGDATFAYFGAMGGGVDGNVQRWKTQFAGTEPKVEEVKAGDVTITIFDATGEYAPDAGTPPQPDQRMLAAIVQVASEDHIFKFYGPRGTVGDWRDAFVEMLKKVRARG